jgi:hypothetical protein
LTLGSYLLGQYYIKINTNKKREEFGLTDKQLQIPEDLQLEMQREFFPVLLHEWKGRSK